MKFLTDRREIAQEINIKRTPVVTIDITKCMDGYEHSYKGTDIEIQSPCDKELYSRCTVEMFGNGKNKDKHNTPWLYDDIGLYEGLVGIYSGFGMADVLDMVHWNNVRRAKQGDEIIVMFKGEDKCFLRKMRIGHVGFMVYPLAKLEDIEEV